MGGRRRLLDMRGDDRRFATIGVYQIDLNQTEEAYDPEFVELLGRVDDYVKVTPLLPGGAHSNVTEIGDLESDKPLYDRMLRSEEHTSELQSLMRISYAVFCLKKKKKHTTPT